MPYTAEDILEERETRIELQNKFMKDFKMPLVCIKANYPGVNKDNSITQEIIQLMDKIVSDIFYKEIQFKLNRQSPEGSVVIMLVDKDYKFIKNLMVQIEDKHPLGRFVDIDVYDHNSYEAISRKDIGLEGRTCFLCHREAHGCVRSRNHPMDEVIKFIEKGFLDYKLKNYGK